MMPARSVSAQVKAHLVEPMLALAVKELPSGAEWSYELKLDGYRALGLKSGAAVRLYSRNGKDFSQRFPAVTRALEALPDETLIDGEVVAVDENGRPSFSSLQNFDRAPVFYAFDLPILAGEDLKQRPLDERRKALRRLTRQLHDPIRFSETFDTSAADMIAVVREQELEGVVAKRRSSFYEPGRRSGAWIKLRVNRRQDFVIGGYVPRGQNFDSILVGYYEGRDLKFAASVRAGFTPASRQVLFAGFAKIENSKCPFSNLPDASKGRWGVGITEEKMAQCRWLKPRIVVVIDFLEWTLDNRLRHASFVAVSTDKRGSAVVRE
jgi:bifunctional non-homologous end joining protein LigD